MERRFTRYHARPLSVRSAMRVIIAATVMSVVLGGILIRIAEPKQFNSVWLGLWWALQTVTTVGYGDVVPQSPFGRMVGAVVMLTSIAFVSIITAVITSSFVARAQRELDEDHHLVGPQRTGEPDERGDLAQRLDEIANRLDRIEEALIRNGEGKNPTLR
jgi:voltage-gated potassium channel Kch